MADHLDNIDLIKPLLKFESSDDFYYLQILQRKKENPELGSNSRVIKNYYVGSVEYLESKYEEIKNLCIQFNARASIRLNKRSYEKVAFKTLENIAHTMMSKDFNHINKCYDRACGSSHNDKIKKWILDIDENVKSEFIHKLSNELHELRPEGDKILAVIPSLSGIHIITTPFDLSAFKSDKIDEIHKDNPTNLFIPRKKQNNG